MALPSADELEQLPEIEKQWAVKATQYAETYFRLISSIDGKSLRLTPIDDEIYQDFQNTFPNFSLIEIDEEEMKSTNGKEIWRNWIMKYEKRVSDYNFGTLLRKNVDGDYTEENTMFGKFIVGSYTDTMIGNEIVMIILV
ncbi:uncharacterized protein OCT59_026423 [Rhizophagus irregularis]|uniref:Polysaccharide biosynthesis domain-containing protein n=1 Tax=Rhizophagus irregularis (strain DAOM 197198w) TaxID=1432141 RepID=A0A015J3U9_RHIIW|nr:hypothetical protein RirG_171200 [Rhizophagus irregularis DAOM 197198w]EXX61441.1 hypothetical protein RirG_171200 [Rhizophagus irregularis DAOM 197198w]UZO06090.1 hypothetical protein OCT59_026423 [Rhizophagus irregularis]